MLRVFLTGVLSIILEKVQTLNKLNMNNDISGIPEEAFYSSISNRMDGEVHESDDCAVVARYGELNEHGRIVVVFIRICHCGKHESNENVFEAKQRLNVPQDGLDVHGNEEWEYISIKYFDPKLCQHLYRFKLTHRCNSKKGMKRVLDYN